VHTCISIVWGICLDTYIYMYIYVSIYAYMYIYTHTYICTYTYTYTYIHIYVMYMHMYIYHLKCDKQQFTARTLAFPAASLLCKNRKWKHYNGVKWDKQQFIARTRAFLARISVLGRFSPFFFFKWSRHYDTIMNNTHKHYAHTKPTNTHPYTHTNMHMHTFTGTHLAKVQGGAKR